MGTPLAWTILRSECTCIIHGAKQYYVNIKLPIGININSEENTRYVVPYYSYHLSDSTKCSHNNDLKVYNHRLYAHSHHIIQPVKMLSRCSKYMFNAWPHGLSKYKFLPKI